MARADVEARQREVKEELERYKVDRQPLIDEIKERVDRLGPLGAASANDRIANARLATYAEGVFLEGTHNADDKAPINFLERGIRAARSVCHIVDSNRTSLGTGFLVAPGLLITNNHVIPDSDTAEGGEAVFQFELDADENPLRPRRFRLEPRRLFATSPKGKLDFTFVGLAAVGEGGALLEAQGWLPLDERPNKILEGQPIVIIQHPNGQMKTLCLFDSVVVLRDKDPDLPYILYTTDTDEGASGSPAFNRFWQVVGLHHASITTGQLHQGRPVVLNRGIRISSIFGALRAGPVDNVLEGPTSHIEAILKALTDPSIRRSGRPVASALEPVPALSVVSSGASTDLVSEGTRRSGTVIRRKPDNHFDDRGGFQPMFLSETPDAAPDLGHPLCVPLPKLPAWLMVDAARLKNRQEIELKYQHFSIVVSASRSLAILTACNVDGSRMYKLSRKDRDPDDFLEPGVMPEAAADVWFYDPRLAEQCQLGPELYDSTSFDYGHLVRRLDPVWGPDDRTPRIANDDTFCMTNCSPQETRFHRTRRDGDGNWSALEDVILNEANLKNRKFVILTGPVLDPRDTTILGVTIPTAFWKIAAYEEQGALRAHGFMLWQTEEVRELDERFEGMIDLSDAKKPVKIREIARVSGLDFGPLFDADVRR
ncbi:DNA/RNA non-specific endonuclease [Sinorhizobium meliloti]|uniref:DNA/RNA non-specific endonuclease n=1 Tax=Rhizobium meliloti TaxID=382 RepID=UPI0018615469|nr:DNA/RNA non-specific endonuclease [Sinorhizobium meliloti]MDE3775426.1 DNA/RNA non-specific endonuclease [Sinorhizobium meliloti]QND34686.1 hypothetical protein HB772_22150 [Sinorhizobium meliloti]